MSTDTCEFNGRLIEDQHFITCENVYLVTPCYLVKNGPKAVYLSYASPLFVFIDYFVVTRLLLCILSYFQC